MVRIGISPHNDPIQMIMHFSRQKHHETRPRAPGPSSETLPSTAQGEGGSTASPTQDSLQDFGLGFDRAHRRLCFGISQAEMVWRLMAPLSPITQNSIAAFPVEPPVAELDPAFEGSAARQRIEARCLLALLFALQLTGDASRHSQLRKHKLVDLLLAARGRCPGLRR